MAVTSVRLFAISLPGRWYQVHIHLTTLHSFPCIEQAEEFSLCPAMPIPTWGLCQGEGVNYFENAPLIYELKRLPFSLQTVFRPQMWRSLRNLTVLWGETLPLLVWEGVESYPVNVKPGYLSSTGSSDFRSKWLQLRAASVLCKEAVTSPWGGAASLIRIREGEPSLNMQLSHWNERCFVYF